MCSVHWRYYETALVPEFWSMIDCLDDMASRWLGQLVHGPGKRSCLADIFANHLRDLHHKCNADPQYAIDILAYSTAISNRKAPSTSSANQGIQAQPNHATQTPVRPPQQLRRRRRGSFQQPAHELQPWYTPIDVELSGSQPRGVNVTHSTDSFRTDRGPMEYGIAKDGLRAGLSPTDLASAGDVPTDELANISYMLLDQSFMDLDRVITLNDMVFSANLASPIDLASGAADTPSLNN